MTLPEIINKVAESGIITFNLEDYFPLGERVQLDIKDWLFEGLILKEKDFRISLQNHDWSQYQDKYVAIHCSTDSIIPTWAYMLLVVRLEPYVKKVILGDLQTLETVLFSEILSKTDVQQFLNQRVVIKGCSNKKIPASAYLEITRLLRPVAKSIMYGEPCSTVPLYKKKD